MTRYRRLIRKRYVFLKAKRRCVGCTKRLPPDLARVRCDSCRESNAACHKAKRAANPKKRGPAPGTLQRCRRCYLLRRGHVCVAIDYGARENRW